MVEIVEREIFIHGSSFNGVSINANRSARWKERKNKGLGIALVYRDADRWALNVHHVVCYVFNVNKGIGLRERGLKKGS